MSEEIIIAIVGTITGVVAALLVPKIFQWFDPRRAAVLALCLASTALLVAVWPRLRGDLIDSSGGLAIVGDLQICWGTMIESTHTYADLRNLDVTFPRKFQDTPKLTTGIRHEKGRDSPHNLGWAEGPATITSEKYSGALFSLSPTINQNIKKSDSVIVDYIAIGKRVSK